MKKCLVIFAALAVVALPAGAWQITNAGFEDIPVENGWTFDASQTGMSNSSSTCGPGGAGSYKDNAGALGGVQWIGWQAGCSNGARNVISQAVSGLPISALDIQVGHCGCTNMAGAAWNIQLRAADGSPAVDFSNATSTGTLLEGHTSAPGPAWDILGDGVGDDFTPAGDTVTIICYGDVTGTGWDAGSGIHFDGVTINAMTPVGEWTLY